VGTNAQLSLPIPALKNAVRRRWKERMVLITDPSERTFRRMADEEGIRKAEIRIGTDLRGSRGRP
jgi:hypothetical protein